MLKTFNSFKNVLPILGGSEKEFVTVSGKIKNEDMVELETFEDSNGDLMITVLFLGRLSSYRVIDIVAVHFKFMEHLPFDVLRRVEAFPIDGNQRHTHAGNLGYRFKDAPVLVEGTEDFFYIPGFPRRAINNRGELISTLDNKALSWYAMRPNDKKNIKGGYYTNRVEVNGKARTMLRHRAMLMVFREYPDNCDSLLTNHIDGTPGHDHLDNLEWADYSLNLEHSYKNNLRTQNRPVIARNILTGEERVFYSVAECGRSLNINDRTINYKLEKCKFSSICRQGYQFKYLNDERDWIIPENPQEELEKFILKQQVLVKDTIDEDSKIFRSIGAAAIATGVSAYRISNQIKKEDKDIIDGFIFCAYEE